MTKITVTCPRCGSAAPGEVFPHHSGAGAVDFECPPCGLLGYYKLEPAELASLQAGGLDVEIPAAPISKDDIDAAERLLGSTDGTWFDFWKAEVIR